MKIPDKLKKKVLKKPVASNKNTKATKEPDDITKITFYLAVSDMAPSVKKAWATLLPHMSDGQLQRLANILEASFLDAATRSIDDQLRKGLELIEQKYAKRTT